MNQKVYSQFSRRNLASLPSSPGLFGQFIIFLLANFHLLQIWLSSPRLLLPWPWPLSPTLPRAEMENFLVSSISTSSLAASSSSMWSSSAFDRWYTIPAPKASPSTLTDVLIRSLIKVKKDNKIFSFYLIVIYIYKLKFPKS